MAEPAVLRPAAVSERRSRSTVRRLVTAASAGRVQLVEFAGAVCIVVGLVLWLGAAAGWIAAGLALLGKSLEWDLRQ